MPRHERRVTELIDENRRLKERVKQLELTRCQLPDDTLKLSIFDKSPFTVWACNKDFKIVLWNKKCEEIYNYSKAEAIGKSFLDLFVDGPEKEEARKDCLEIIEHDKRCDNFLAYDNDRKGQRRTMLTNCFRIWGPDANEWLQAEVGLQVDFELKLERHKHQELREIGIEMLQQTKMQIEAKKKELQARVKASCREKGFDLYKQNQDIGNWEREMENAGVDYNRNVILGLKHQVEERLLKVQKDSLALERAIYEASDIDVLESLERATVDQEKFKLAPVEFPSQTGPAQ